MDKSRSSRWILFALLLAVLLRVGLLVIAISYPDRIIETDSGSYLQPAQSLLEDGYYSDPIGVRMPMYPVLLAATNILFGDNLLAVVVIQILMGLATIYITYRTGILLGLTQTASVLGAVILSLSLESLLSAYFILSETLFTFLLISATYALVQFIRNGRLIWLVLTALLTGFAALCRPIAMAFWLASLIILLVFNKNASFLKRLGHVAICIALVIVLFLAPWTYRNAQVVGAGTLTTESNLYWLWSAAMINADLQGITVDQAKIELDNVVSQTLIERDLEQTESNFSYISGEIGKKIVFTHFGRFIFLTLRYDLRCFLPGMGFAVKFLGLSQGSTEGLEVLQSQGILGVINNYFHGQALAGLIFLPFVILLAATCVGAVIGVVDLFKKRAWLALAALLLPIGSLLVITGYNSSSRLRIPVMPFLALLAGSGLIMFWNFLQPKLAKRFKRVK